MTTLQATSAAGFVSTLGVNTHIDFNAYGYQDLTAVETALRYLGVPNVRDSGQSSADLSSWQQVAQATGVKFDDYMPEGSPAAMQTTLSLANQLAAEGVLNYLEGGNEEDDDYAISQGNSLGYAAQFQQQVAAAAHALGLPAINMSFGSGWTAANNWQGNYGSVGDLSAVTDYANAHTYPNAGQAPDSSIQQLNADALLAANRPVMTTEMGWDSSAVGQQAVAQYIVQAALDGAKNGDAGIYFYALFNDSSGNYGLMNADGSPLPAGTALHNLITLLADNGGAATSGSLDVTLNGAQSGDNTLVFHKSDGSQWLAIWNESGGGHSVTVNLPNAVSRLVAYDPVTGTAPIGESDGSSSISVNLGNDPLLIEIDGAGVPSGTAGGSTGSVATATSGSTGGTATDIAGGTSVTGGIPSDAPGVQSPVPAPPGTPDTSTGSTTATTTRGGSVGGPDPTMALPAAANVTAGQPSPITGVSAIDDWAAGAPGTLALNMTANGGNLAVQDPSGNALHADNGGTVQLDGSLAQINAALQTLSFTSNGGVGSLAFNLWDQSGAQGNATLAVSTDAGAAVTNDGSTAPAGGSGTVVDGSSDTTAATGSTTGIDVAAGTGSTSSSDAGIVIAPDDGGPVITASNTSISAGAGDHMIFIAGTQDSLIANGGNETVQAYNGGNTITTGDGNDTLRFSGGGNTIDAGGGSNQLFDSSGNNTIALPGAGQGFDEIRGYLMSNGDVFDLRNALAGAGWNGDAATLSNYLGVSMSGNDAVISVNPSGNAGAGGGQAIAQFDGTGPISLDTLLAHALT